MSRLNINHLGFILLALTALAACSSPPEALSTPAAASSNTSQGERIAILSCSACHAVGRADASPHADAPPFRDLSRNYSFEGLRETLPEGLIVDHPDMPVFQLDADETDALIKYLEEIQAIQSAAATQRSEFVP